MGRVVVSDDVLQQETQLDVPEIRVWCHPEKVGHPEEDDFYIPFCSFGDALSFCDHVAMAEDYPMVAFAGKELDIYTLLVKDEDLEPDGTSNLTVLKSKGTEGAEEESKAH